MSVPYVDAWGEDAPPSVRHCDELRRLVQMMPMPEYTRTELLRTIADLRRLLERAD